MLNVLLESGEYMEKTMEEWMDDASPFDLLNNKNYTTKEIKQERYDTCLGCKRLFMPTRTCRECNCFMSMKTWLKHASCPLGKWGPVSDDE